MAGTGSQNGPFYHGTSRRFLPGHHIIPAAELNPANPRAAQAHPVLDEPFGNNSNPGATFMTEWRKDAESWGPNVYRVEPLAEMFADWNGSDGDYEVCGHLIVLGTA